MWKISLVYRIKNKELHRGKVERNLLQTVKIKVNWIVHVLRSNCLLNHVTEGEIEGRLDLARRRGSRPKQLLYDLKETKKYWKY